MGHHSLEGRVIVLLLENPPTPDAAIEGVKDNAGG
jgi:hypothetical protein